MTPAEQDLPPRPRRRWAVAVLLVVAVLLALWLSRVPIARGLIGRELARRGVPARYEIADLGLGRQRLTNVAIGDPARPDLVADWIETRTKLTAAGPRIAGVRAGRLRLRARWSDGRLSLGALDKLIPQGGGGRFALPRIDLAAEDARAHVEMPWGTVGAALRGRGRLDDGFDGRLALVADRLGTGGCGAERVAASLRLRSTGGERVAIEGPAKAARLACAGGDVQTMAASVDARLALDADHGSTARVRFASGTASYAATRAAALEGEVALTHLGGAALSATGEAAARQVRAADVTAGRIGVSGIVRRQAGLDYAGTVTVADADAATLLPALGGAGAGTPIGPIVARVEAAVRGAARRFSGEAEVRASLGDTVSVQASRINLRSASGARATFAGGSGAGWDGRARMSVDGRLRIGGGGLPELAAVATQPRADGSRQVVVTMAPYAVEGARLALQPVRWADGAVSTVATLSGPLGDGRVEGLAVPLDIRFGRAIAVNPRCTPMAFERIAVSGFALRPARLILCPTGPALFTIVGSQVTGGARLGATELAGALGKTPLSLAATGVTIRLADRGFALEGVRATIGQPERVSRLDVARLNGAIGAHGLAGSVAGAAGSIANVPLALADAAGAWQVRGGTLTLTGALSVGDAAAEPRFERLAAHDVRLTLAGDDIAATGTLAEPTKGVKIAEVTIAHRLSTGAGHAHLAVPGLTFTPEFQPDLLTKLTFGVVADVKATITGQGDIAWDAGGVTSTGTFSTTDASLAAAFGPVEGIGGTIRFTDLLGLETAPGQLLTVRSINPGVPVTDGRITYQLLRGARIALTDGQWPFAGGTLTLAPSVLDFSSPQERRLTFTVTGMDAGQFLQEFDFKNLDARGTFDGTLPMVFDASGGRIEGGVLAARAGGGSLAYVGELTEKDLGFWGNVAFQTLRSLTYRELAIHMNGPLAGEMVTEVRFAGIRQGKGAKSNFILRRLTRLPIVFNVRIRAPFRGLIDSAASFYDPSRLVARNLQQLLDAQNAAGANAAPQATDRAIQPPASETVP